MTRITWVVLAELGLPSMSGCAGSASGDAGLGGASAIGDENGGKIPGGVGAANAQSSAFAQVTSHCARFGKKGFITRMDYESGTLTFECRTQKPKAGA